MDGRMRHSKKLEEKHATLNLEALCASPIREERMGMVRANPYVAAA